MFISLTTDERHQTKIAHCNFKITVIDNINQV